VNIPYTSLWAGDAPNCPSPGGSRHHLMHGSLAHRSAYSKRHLGRFSRFSVAHGCIQKTQRSQNICNNRPHLCTLCTQCGFKRQVKSMLNSWYNTGVTNIHASYRSRLRTKTEDDVQGGDVSACDEVTSAGCDTPGYGSPGGIDPRTPDELSRDSWWYGEYGDPNGMP